MLVSRKEYTTKFLNNKKVDAIRTVYYHDNNLTSEQKKKHEEAVKKFEAETKKKDKEK